jgi:protein-serine/threonine kinase
LTTEGIHSPPSSRQHSPSLRSPSTPVGSTSNGATTATTHSNALAAPRPQLPLNTSVNASASDMLRAVAGQR